MKLSQKLRVEFERVGKDTYWIKTWMNGKLEEEGHGNALYVREYMKELSMMYCKSII